MQAQGVILQASYRIAGSGPGAQPIVHLFGRMENGETFLLRDFHQVPHFYINAHQAKAATEAQVASNATSGWTNFSGQPVQRVQVPIPSEAPIARDRLHALGIPTFEADVRFAYRYLIDRGIKGAVEFSGDAQVGSSVPGNMHVDWVLDNPQLAPSDLRLPSKVLAFDIETDPRRDRLLAISVYGAGLAEVLVVDPGARRMPEATTGYPDEAGVLRRFLELVRHADPDVITGWNCIDFDLQFLDKVAQRTRVPLELGRMPGKLKMRPAQGYFGSSSANVVGRLVMDGIDLLRGAFVRMESYSLDAVARTVLGEGKVLEGDVKDRVGEILHNYQHNLPAFSAYSLADSRLVLEILERLDLISLAFARSRLTGMMPDRVSASIASFDFMYLSELRKQKIVAPTVGAYNLDGSHVHEPQAGGQVFEPVTGLHQDVLVFDFKSLYPSIIRTFNIDPVSYIDPDNPTPPDNPIELGEARFARTPAILPALLDDLFPQRQQAKDAGDAVASQAIKILMNSMYGVLGTPACRFYNPAIANAITGQGRHLLRWMRDWFQHAGLQVLYGDTDSVFVMAEPGLADPDARGQELVDQANLAVAEYVQERWGVKSALELEFEKRYDKLFLPSVRGGSAGARKRYVGRNKGVMEFVGLEVVRRDWTELAKRVQRELYERLFEQAAVADYLRQMVAQLRAGDFDDLLVYHKGLRRSVDSYTANTPPHVAAARKSKEPPGRIIRYLMTQAGPEPLDNLTAPVDREHYLHKQLRPVAEPVLDTLGLQFDQVVGDDKQMGLF